jgi:hypothetical protein
MVRNNGGQNLMKTFGWRSHLLAMLLGGVLLPIARAQRQRDSARKHGRIRFLAVD